MSDTIARIENHQGCVRIGGTQQRITLGNATVAKINANRPNTVVQPRNTPVNVTDRPTLVKAGGGMGVQGVRGEPGGSIPAISFSFGDAAHTVWTPDAPGLLTYLRILIDTAFDGEGAAIIVGTLSEPDAAMPADYSNPAALQEFENTPDIRLDAGEGVRLAITPGSGATQGAGRLILQFLPD